MQVTIKDVAADCGVSPTVASAALRGKTGSVRYSEKTRELVRRSAEKLGYRPNLLARSLVRKKSNTIGLILPTLKAIPAHHGIFMGVRSEAALNSYRLITCHMEDENLFSDDELDFLLNSRIDGLIVLSRAFYKRKANYLKFFNAGIPLVNCYCRVNKPGVDCIRPDIAKCTRIAIEHLISQGCSEIGVINNSDRNGSRSRSISKYGNLSIIKVSMKMTVEKNLPFSYDRIISTEQSPQGGAAAIAELLDRFPNTDGVFIESDMKAVGAVHEIQRRGMRIPDDIAIISLDNLQSVSQFSPVSLTSVDPGKFEGGKTAFKLLLDRIKSGERGYRPRIICLEPELIVRESSLLKKTIPE